MGRGNVCVTGKYEGLFYIDNDYFHVYRENIPWGENIDTRLLAEMSYEELTGNDWVYDEWGTMEEMDDIEECFTNSFSRMFPSFEKSKPNHWIDRDRRVILENKLFYICMVDNEWSMAVELIQKEEPWGEPWMENLQKRLYEKYLDGMKRCLLERLPSVGIYSGAWTSKVLRREDIE